MAEAQESSPKRLKADDDVIEAPLVEKELVERVRQELAPPPRISFITGGGAYIWHVADIATLRNGRIGGQLVGGDLRFPAQTRLHGVPLSLTPEELPVACQLLDLPVPETHAIDTLKARIFCEMHRRGFWLARGTSFGSDYLVYTGDPNVYHAAYLLVVKEWHEATPVLSHVTLARLGSTVKKTALIASQKPDGTFWFHTLKWLGI